MTHTLLQSVRQFWRDESGVSAIEYGLIAALIAAAPLVRAWRAAHPDWAVLVPVSLACVKLTPARLGRWPLAPAFQNATLA